MKKSFSLLICMALPMFVLCYPANKYKILTICQDGRWSDASGTINMKNVNGYMILDTYSGGNSNLITWSAKGDFDLSANSGSWRLNTWVKEYRKTVSAVVTMTNIGKDKYRFDIKTDGGQLDVSFEAAKVLTVPSVNISERPKEKSVRPLLIVGVIVILGIVLFLSVRQISIRKAKK